MNCTLNRKKVSSVDLSVIPAPFTVPELEESIKKPPPTFTPPSNKKTKVVSAPDIKPRKIVRANVGKSRGKASKKRNLSEMKETDSESSKNKS